MRTCVCGVVCGCGVRIASYGAFAFAKGWNKHAWLSEKWGFGTFLPAAPHVHARKTKNDGKIARDWKQVLNLMSETPVYEGPIKKLKDIEHALLRPAMVVGSPEIVNEAMWVLADNDRIQKRKIDYLPALYKILDELFVNAVDHAQRTLAASDPAPVKCISVNVSQGREWIEVTNDGRGIDVAMHAQEGVYVPELLFSQLRTGSNFNDDTDRRMVGGQNGYGATLAVIFSKEFQLVTVDQTRQLRYEQHFFNNLSEIRPPVITKCKTKPLTSCRLLPDYDRFGLDAGITPDILALIHRRVHDLAAVSPRSVTVKLNGQSLRIPDFKAYIDLFVPFG